MLPAPHRLRDSADFSAVLRSRRSGRASGPALVVTAGAGPGGRRRVGLIVSRAVGNSVLRSRVKRVLRHGMAPLLGQLPADTDIVIRANPAAGRVPACRLRADLAKLVPAAVERSRR